ncbi:MAG TPA: hypothetical protein VGS62_11855 [Streptosporangiaceae bacterium]|nr:hypothetical protein [Streptosporangiaceae bacterium]
MSPRHRPANRRVVILIATAGLLVLVLSVVEGGEPTANDAGHAISLWSSASSQTAWSTPIPMPLRATAKLSGPAAQGGMGPRLLAQAAAAAQAISYYGVRVITWRASAAGGAWPGARAGTVMVDVRHVGGQPSDAVFGITPKLLPLLDAHYAVTYLGTGTAEGRRAWIVEALRGDGTVAAKFWVDSVTNLPLRRQVFLSGSQPVSQDALTGLKVGTPGSGVGQARLATPKPWSDRLGPAQLANLQATGWPVPGPRSAGLDLLEATQSVTAAGKVVDLSYSDGLSVVSLFLQRGQLPAVLSGWQRIRLDGDRVYVRDPAQPDLTWSASGYVFTVVADAPAPVVTAMVNTLPHDRSPGFWGRMKRGLKRLLSWVDPFA